MAELKARELRIGNLVCSQINRRKEMKILQLFSDSFQGEIGSDRGAFMYSSCEGIIIKDKLLLAYGFIQDRVYKYRYELGTFILHRSFVTNSEQECWALALDYGHLLRTEIIYLHQLQNLYFALTSSELVIK